MPNEEKPVSHLEHRQSSSGKQKQNRLVEIMLADIDRVPDFEKIREERAYWEKLAGHKIAPRSNAFPPEEDTSLRKEPDTMDIFERDRAGMPVPEE